MNYTDLNKTQKRIVDAFVRLKPELADSASITRTEVEELFAKLTAERENGGPKMGYPMWLVKGPKISRGVYVFPAPNAVTSDIIASISNRSVQTTAEDEEFMAELRDAGIEV